MPLSESSYPHKLALDAQTTYLIFYSDVVDGRMWCPDCRAVEETVKKAFGGEDKPKGIIYWVGNRDQWRAKDNSARNDWNVHNVPTIVRLENGKETARLVENDILDSAKFKAFLA